MREGLVYEGVQEEPMEYSGGSAAQSSLLHCFDELLGVQHEEQSGKGPRAQRALNNVCLERGWASKGEVRAGNPGKFKVAWS